ncbi:MAG: hypothetical protein ACHQIH_00695 [Ignavibacteria bacterium]
MIKLKKLNFLFLNVFLAVLLITFIASGCGKKTDSTKTGDNKESSTDEKSSGEVSADSPIHVKMNISGTMNGTVDAYYHNKKSKSTSQMEISGRKISASMYFDGGEYVYMVSDAAGMITGMKYKRDEYAKSKKEGEFDALTFKDQLKNMDKIGEEVILGKKCDIYKSKDGKFQFSIYKEMVPLKFSSGEGKMVMEAKEFETDAKFSDDIFTAPTDVKYSDATEMMKDMKNMNDKMKDLDKGTKQMEDVLKKYAK